MIKQLFLIIAIICAAVSGPAAARTAGGIVHALETSHAFVSDEACCEMDCCDDMALCQNCCLLFSKAEFFVAGHAPVNNNSTGSLYAGLAGQAYAPDIPPPRI